jgi:hypothetical protein
MRSWLVLVVLASGCWSERTTTETTPSIASLERTPEPWPSSGRSHAPRGDQDRCARVVAHVFGLARRDATSSGFTPAMLDDIEVSSVESCHETQWSDEILGCYEGTTSTAQMGECYRTMTDEQREDFERRFMDIRLRHRNNPPPLPSPPPPPTP